MNAIVSSLYRDLTCAAGALLISLVVSASFVQLTGNGAWRAWSYRRRLRGECLKNGPLNRGVSHEHLRPAALS